MTQMIMIPVEELQGRILDWAVAEACGWPHPNLSRPSSDWAQGGPLIQEYGVLISPPESRVHINGGPNAGWRESGYWGSSIFREPRKHSRRAYRHYTNPLVAAMRAIVNWHFGDEIAVPVDLLEGNA